MWLRIGSAFSWFQLVLFSFWFRFDLFTKQRSNRAFKACAAIALVEVWLAGGTYAWAEVLLSVGPPPREVLLGVPVAIVGLNANAMRRGNWEEWDGRFNALSRVAQRRCMWAGAAITAAAFGWMLTGVSVLRSW